MNHNLYIDKISRKPLLMALVMCASVVLSSCIQSQSASQASYVSPASVSISDNTLKLVNRVFQSNFIGGDWYYQGAQAVNGTINAYIQIPQSLDMSKEVQRNYLQKAICPGADKQQLWKSVKGIPLTVHLYTFNKRHTVYAECTNPLA